MVNEDGDVLRNSDLKKFQLTLSMSQTPLLIS